MIRFSLFGIPIEIQPFFWIISAMLGGALYADTKEAFLAVALFVLAAFVSVLIHELGHALTGRKLGGGYASIMLTSFGGLAMNHGGRFNRQQRFWMVAAGPGAGFAFLLAILAVLCLIFDSAEVLAFVAGELFDLRLPVRTDELLEFFRAKPFIYLLLGNLVWINFWWGVINLLPVMPLDGGQIAELYIKPQSRVFAIGMVTAGAMALFGLWKLNSFPTALIFGYLAWQNYQNMQRNSWR